MRVAALADVHGNAVALAAVLAEVEREQPDLIVSCGDLTWGPLPRETVALLEPWRDRARFVRGNSERELLERKLVDSEVARWEHEQHDDPELLDYVRGTRSHEVVDVDGLGPTRFCHGSPRSDEECVTAATPAERVAEFTAGVEEACVVTAHTHMQYDRRVGETRLLNPGQRRPAVRARAGIRLLGAARPGRRAAADAVRPRGRDRADAGRGHAQVRADRGADAHTAVAGRGDRARRARRLLGVARRLA